ncbi:MAG: hypothetical protein JO266_06255 [Acidobacteria bacterium]|nr:hypothetical protein [Acidobacteriota bacterium]
MPRSKHRRKGRVRLRQNRKAAPQLPPLPSIDYEWERHKSAVEEEQLREMYGGDWDDWTDDDIDEARRQMWHESAARKPDPAV